MVDSMKKMFFNLFSSVFSDSLNRLLTSERDKAVSLFRKLESERKQEYSLLDLGLLVGKPVIAISNEWDNPVIGFAKEITLVSKANNPYLVVHDYLTGQEVIPLGKVFFYTEQRFEAVMKLDPFELCSLLYTNSFSDRTFVKDIRQQRDSREDLVQKLTESGFYDRVENLDPSMFDD